MVLVPVEQGTPVVLITMHSRPVVTSTVYHNGTSTPVVLITMHSRPVVTSTVYHNGTSTPVVHA